MQSSMSNTLSICFRRHLSSPRLMRKSATSLRQWSLVSACFNLRELSRELTNSVVYWLVLFSIVVHGLSIPALNAFYKFRGVRPIQEDNPAEIHLRSSTQALPKNAKADLNRRSVMVHNRFSVMPERPGNGDSPEGLARLYGNTTRTRFNDEDAMRREKPLPRVRDSWDSMDVEKGKNMI